MLKRFAIVFLAVAAVAFLAVDLLLVWVATGPRQAPWLTPHIEAAFAAPDGSYTVDIGDTWLAWGSFRHPIDVRLRDVQVLTRDKAVFSSFPEISIGIVMLALPLGQVLPTTITIDKPAINLTQNEDKSISFGFGKYESIVAPVADQTLMPEVKATPVPKPEATLSIAAALAPLLSPPKSGPLRALHRITISHASVGIGSAAKGMFFELADSRIEAERDGDSIALSLDGTMLYGEQSSKIAAEFIFGGGDPAVEGTVEFASLIPGALGTLFADNPALRIFNAPLSGKTTLSMDGAGNLKRLLFDVSSGPGYLTSSWLSDSLPVNSSHIAGQIGNDLKDIQIDALSVTMGKTELTGSGVVNLSEDDAAVHAKLTLRNAAAADVKLLWPPALAPESRAWVIENITHGIVPEAQGRINIRPGDLKKPVLPREAVDVSIGLENATIRYLPEHPPVTKTKGMVYIDGVSLKASIAASEFLQSTKMSGGKVEIDDLNADNPYIKVSFDAATTARDAAEFLKLPRLERTRPLSLHAESAQGEATLHAAMGFHFYAPPGKDGKPGEPDLDYEVAANIKDFAAPGFLSKFDIKGAGGALTVDNRHAQFKGSGNVNGASASQADVTYTFEPEQGIDTIIDVAARAPVESLPKFGYPALTFAKGTLGVKASLKQGPQVEEASAVIDLADVAIDAPALGWKKPDKEAAALDLKAEKKDGTTRITSFRLSGKGVEASGSATLSKDFSSIAQIALGKTKIGETDLERFDYANANNSVRLEAFGKALDLSGWFDSDEENNEFSFEHFPAVQFKANIEKLDLSKSGSIRSFKGEMACDAKRCQSANVTGLAGDGKEFTFRILKNPKGKRQFSLHAADAGMFLKAFGISEPDVEGGTLSISGNYDELPAGSILRGKMVISDYTVKKAPVLAKILSLASLTGIVDLLQGGGISFSKLNAPFTLQNDIVKFEKAKAYGGSIGITADGTLQFPQRVMDISGTVVPAYVLNNMLGKVPLIGPILTGGGGGVFAFDYRVKGTEKNSDVSVNPLSILTPGFLRNLFSGGD